MFDRLLWRIDQWLYSLYKPSLPRFLRRMGLQRGGWFDDAGKWHEGGQLIIDARVAILDRVAA